MPDSSSPIGIFDSGLGGISVLRVLLKDMPGEDYVFFGDCINAPYGDKTEDRIREMSEASFNFLLEKDAKCIVIACNTATSAAADYLRSKYPDKIIIGMEPALKPAATSGKDHPCVLLLGTASTIKGDRVKHLVERFDELADIHLMPAPGIVPLVEAGKADSPEMVSYLKGLLKDFCRQDDGSVKIKVDGVVLGCTHFPFVVNSIKEALGYDIEFFDGAYGTSRQTKRRLQAAGLLNPREEGGSVSIYTSSGKESLRLANELLNQSF